MQMMTTIIMCCVICDYEASAKIIITQHVLMIRVGIDAQRWTANCYSLAHI